MGLTTELARDLFHIQLNERDREKIRTLIVDFFAAAYAGYKQNRTFNVALEKIVYAQGGAEESCVLFQGKKYPARLAAFMNSVYGHGAELDDGNKKAAGHAGVHLIPAVFALADRLGSDNEDVLTALATGYEAFIRIASAAQPGLIARGFHSTGMAGTLACAAACARLYHLNAQGIEDAIAVGSPAKVIKYRFDEKTIERLQGVRWWDWPIETIRAASEYLHGDLNEEKLRRLEAIAGQASSDERT